MTAHQIAGRGATLAVLAWTPVATGDSPVAPTGPSATPRTMPKWDEEDGRAHTPIESGTYLIPSSVPALMWLTAVRVRGVTL